MSNMLDHWSFWIGTWVGVTLLFIVLIVGEIRK